MNELRQRVEFLEKTLFEYIERDKARLLEREECLKKELRAARTTVTKLQNEIRKGEEKRQNVTKKVKQILESE